MRLATWNINGLRARLSYLLLWLEEVQPDIVGLQELKVSDDQLPLIELEAAGYQIASHGQVAWNGVAVLAKTQPQVEQIGLPGQEQAGARLIATSVGDIDFVTVYIPNGKTVDHADFPAKIEWLDAFVDWVEGALKTDRQTLVCGDFNLCPGPLDSWSEATLGGGIFHTEDERSRYRRLLDLGLVDLYRERHPDEPGFTWWDYRAGAFHKKQGLRIDLLLGTRALADRIDDVVPQRDWRKKKEGLISSDHAPVYVDLE